MIKLEKVCPKCGSHLIVKEGQYGEFFACPRFPDCKYTEPIAGGVNYELYKPPNPYCEKCNHTGLLPFVKGDRVISNASIYCECYEDALEYHHPILSGDFDFPCSYSWRAYYEETFYGRYLPSIEPPEEDVSEPEPEWTHRQWAIVQQLQADLQGFIKRFYQGLNEIKQQSTSKRKYSIK